jgi:hypothetical protein
MKFHRSIFAAVLAVAALGAATVAQARSDVSWSIGVGAPGVGMVVGNAPVYVQPQPVYVQPAPVYYQQPAPVYQRPQPVVYQRPPVFVQPQVVYPQPGWRPEWRHHRHHWDGDRGWDR